MKVAFTILSFVLIASVAAADDIQVVVTFNGAADPSTFAKHGGQTESVNHALRFVAGHITPARIRNLRREANVASVEEDGVATTCDQVVPWGVDRVNAPVVHSAGTTGTGVTVAVCDTGVNSSHPDLAGQVIYNKNFSSSKTASDKNGHGTHVSGTIAALNNTQGVIGVAYGAKIANIKVLGDTGSGQYTWIANGITHAADQGYRVISISLGGYSTTTALENAVNYAWGKGCLVICAAGNDNTSSKLYPGAYTTSIAVVATDSANVRASWSNFGDWVDVAAPGVAILSCTFFSAGKNTSYSYQEWSGTSMATPHVSGVAALVIAKNGALSAAQVRALLESTATELGTAGFDTLYGNGLVNAAAAVSGAGN